MGTEVSLNWINEMLAATNFLNIWGPALLVCFTVALGVIYQGLRQTDLKDAINKRFDDMKASIDHRFEEVNRRFDDVNRRITDLRELMVSEFKRVDERIDRLETPILRK